VRRSPCADYGFAYVRYRTEASGRLRLGCHDLFLTSARTLDTAKTTRAFGRLGPSAPSIRRLKFGRDNTFHAVVKQRVEAHLRSVGRSERDCPEMYLKTAIIFASFMAVYALLVFGATAWWQAVPLAVLLALTIVAIGFNVMHDASHSAYSDSPFVGGSSHFWHWKHVVFHHTFVNVVGYDTDINLAGLGRLTPHHPRAAAHRWQHWYVWLLYGAMAMKWHLYDDFRLAFNGRMGEHVAPGPRRRELAVFIAGKVFFFTLAFGLPLVLHPPWVVAAVYLLTGSVLGLVLGTVFQLAHCVELADFPLERSPGHIETAWAVHQVETTVDFARGSAAAAWLLGGLNFQIEHHLFSRICHVNYPAIAPIVEQTCAEFGVRYNRNPTVVAAVRSHYRWLRRMGMPAEAA
jgi:linoleoyl-CoA desaturase